MTNVGRKPIAAAGTGKAAATRTSVAVWSLPRRGSPSLLTRVPLASDLAPGRHWTGVIPTEVLDGASPGMLLLRLEVAGSPKRLITSPPGVFQIDPIADDPAIGASPAPQAAEGTEPTLRGIESACG